MKKTIVSITLATLAVSMVFVVSCTKVEEEVKNTTTTAEDITRTETYLGSVFNICDDVASNDSRINKTGSTLLPPGAVLLFEDSVMDANGVKYSLDFGPLPGLLCLDGVTRAGKIEVTQTKKFDVIGCVLTVNIPETNNFAVSTTGGMTQVSGTAVATRITAEKVNLTITNGKASNAKDGTVTFSSNKDITHLELGAPGTADDEYKGTGSGSGTNTKGIPYTWNTESEVVKVEKPNCSFPIKGIIKLTSEAKDYKIDFEPDGGGCDKKVQITLPNGTKVTKTF